MGNVSKQPQELNISRGVNPRSLLAARGMKDDTSRLPAIPDLVGYLLGFMMLWLIYVGVGSVAKVVQAHKPKVVALASKTSQLAETAKEKTAAALDSSPTLEDIADAAQRVGARGQLKRKGAEEAAPAVDAEPQVKRGWIVQRLVVVNGAVQGAVDYLAQGLQGIFSDVETVEASPSEEEAVPARNYRPDPSGNSLEYF